MASSLFRIRCSVPCCEWRAFVRVADSELAAAALLEEHYEAEHQDVQAAIKRHPAGRQR